ncbi:putative polypeptide N-acetylgalactosaminyltransferase 10 [Aplysia californica]|uniref:Polypeptide N-acetylgalactosaminyltransferase n=1 Tax=Aplysia californica TaxID=6500 RepID=A0ABM1A084_APLCA|nr:putative polypeptide N-acetylgalactosaminyltransferase 10 [Aplysia californica]
MRRNTVTLLKYLVGSTLLVSSGVAFLHAVHWMKTRPKGEVLDVPKYENNRAVPDTSMRVVFDEILERTRAKRDKIDWHDYKSIEAEKQRQGPGEQGAAYLMSPSEQEGKDLLYRSNGFNALVSDKISTQRSLRDIRHPDCQKKQYLKYLPTASFILPFHNEHLSTLIRSVYSILNRAPRDLVKEIILADDHSTKTECHKPLDDYVKEHFTNVRVVRAEKREGLIRTRLMGARQATGEVLIFLDSHIECNVNFLPPLLEPIAENYRTVVCPFIDVIDYETFAYRAQDEGARGAFDWEMFYKRLPLTEKDKRHPAEPFPNPVMAGGLFAISREWFWEMGGYDPGLDIWGGEQYELSFKVWQCGGTMVDAPCSRIGHIYRKFAPFPNPGVGDFVGRNYKRVAEVWMDEYAEFLYKHRPHYRNIDPGDLSAQKNIRKKLNCKPFKWFMTEVAFDLVKYYPPVEPPPLAEGEIRNNASNMCIDTRFKGQNRRFELQKCVRDQGGGGEQQFEFTWHKDIRPKRRNLCFDASSSNPKSPVILFTCHGMQGNQRFKYNVGSQQLYHPISGLCLDSDKSTQEIFMNPCDEANSQRWHFEKFNRTALEIDYKVPLQR